MSYENSVFMTPEWACGAPGLHFPQRTEANPGGGRGGLRSEGDHRSPEPGSLSPGKLQRVMVECAKPLPAEIAVTRGFPCGGHGDPLCSPALPAPPGSQCLFVTFRLISTVS